ncbi:PE-PPE domain-containing protein [Mycobacterium botniense]|uniref:PE-PPE domain-containing protein n=1 Tax=Mycobacterium botniense TaxID=84962 RepID=UPI001FEA648D|nr:PE-PPE domain-containing protein [Mycobacterium botniense]
MAVAIVSTALIGWSPTIPSALGAGADAVSADTVLLAGGTALIMGGTGPCCTQPEPPPSPSYVAAVDRLYVSPHFPGYTVEGLYTPEQFHPFTGLTSATFDQSVSAGASDLNTAIMQQFAAGNNAVVLGISQSATVETLELEHLAALPADARPGSDQLSFVLLGDGNNPDGGFLARFPGLDITSIGLTFSGATPDDVYPTAVYSLEYDGWADFPRYPIDILADLNAFAGMAFVHGLYPDLTSTQLATAVAVPTEGPTLTTYELIPTENLPLLDPVRDIPIGGNALADLLQPDLSVIVNLGYGNPDYGWSTGPANVATPAGLFPPLNDIAEAIALLMPDTVRGVDNALAAVGLPPLPNLPVPSFLPDPVNFSLPSWPAALTMTDTLAVSPRVGAVIDGALNELDSVLNTAINDDIDPVIQGAVYAVGDPLRAAATALGAPERITNAIYVGEQALPSVLEGPGTFVTNDVHFLVTAIEDLAAGNLSGFGQELQLIPAADITLAVMVGALLPALALEDILAGIPFNI